MILIDAHPGVPAAALSKPPPAVSNGRMQNGNRVMLWIMLAVLAWGAFHALGAFLNHEDRANPVRPLIVLACVVAFNAFWLALLWTRKARRQ